MKKIIPVILILLLSSLIVIGSSGTFVYFNTEREVKVAVVPHDEEYISFMCYDGYAATVVVDQNSQVEFDALTIGNYLNELERVWIWLDPDYSDLPTGAEMWIESENGVEKPIDSQQYYTFLGNITVDTADPGTYIVPVTIYARWDDGDAVIEACSIRVIILSGPTIRKVLLSGNTTGIPLKTYQEWVFQIIVNNSGTPRNLTIKDVIPGEFNVDLNRTSASKGTYAFTRHGKSDHLEWDVELGPGESAHMNITISTRWVETGHGGKWEFTTCGTYPLNEGAKIVGYNITSNNITVVADVDCEDDGNCEHDCGGSSKKCC
ncbi:hypothetical protein [Thermococcus sp. EP1]|uniref:hypothetical protein n=1 Tax=Thermococcus sp. EP1 TaxID=1591054 RepID=UPI0006DC061D|nr:hypothetical protein [Thermococcus sp. EP1]